MPREFPGWLTLRLAAVKYGLHYQSLLRMVADGVFTRGRFTSTKDQAPIYLRVDELDAWKLGGVDAVRRVQGGAKPDEPAFSNDLGGEA